MNMVLVFVVGLLPFFLWKLLGAYRRIFFGSTSAWYKPLNEFGEVMEAVSALFILAAFINF